MNTISRTITGGVLVVLGVAIVVTAIQSVGTDALVPVVLGVLIAGIGGYIFFNTSEDTIEEVDTK